MTSNSILYYPSIEFQSDEWVKSSLLLWDKIYRIVPKDYKPKDNRTIKEFVDSDLIRNIILDKDDVTETGDEFIQLYNNLPFLPAGLEPCNEDRIHPDKIDIRLYPLIDNIIENFQHDGWLMLPKELARGYMFYLAKTVAKRRNFVRGTDDSNSWSIAPFFTENANFDEFMCDVGSEGFYCSLFLEDIIPSGIRDIPANKIIHFVKRRKDLKELLRTKLDILYEKLISINNNEQKFIELNDFLDQLEKDKNELRKSMDFWHSYLPSSIFTVGIPMSATAFGILGLSGNPFSAKNISSSILLGAVASYMDYNLTKKKNRDSSYMSYLIQVDKLVDSKLPYKLMRNLEEFIND